MVPSILPRSRARLGVHSQTSHGPGRSLLLGWVAMVAITVMPWSFLPPLTSQAAANGDAIEIFRGREGQYEVIVGIQPEDPVVGTVHFTITPLDSSSSLPVTDAEIVIVANDQSGNPTYQARAINTPDSPQYYDANITFETPGTWTLLVSLQSRGSRRGYRHCSSRGRRASHNSRHSRCLHPPAGGRGPGWRLAVRLL